MFPPVWRNGKRCACGIWQRRSNPVARQPPLWQVTGRANQPIGSQDNGRHGRLLKVLTNGFDLKIRYHVQNGFKTRNLSGGMLSRSLLVKQYGVGG
jgi:hypothetical protein